MRHRVGCYCARCTYRTRHSALYWIVVSIIAIIVVWKGGSLL